MAGKAIFALLLQPALSGSMPLCVVGGGPGGVTLAHELSTLNYAGEIHLFEREGDLGGKAKSVEVNGVIQELGACYTSPDYTLSFELLKDTGITPLPFDLINERTAFDKSLPHDDKCGAFDFMHWATAKIAAPPNNVPAWLALPTIAEKVYKYDLIRRWAVQELFGESDFGKTAGMLTPRNDDYRQELLNMTFDQFLVKHGLETIKPLLLVAQTIQGYGLLDEIPAYYGLLWLQASTFGLQFTHPFPLTTIPPQSQWCGYGNCHYSVHRVAGALKEGWQEFIRRLAARVPNLKVHLNSQVTEISSSPTGRSSVTVNGKTIDCSAVVIATGESTKLRKLVRGMHPAVDAAFAAQKIGAKWYVTVVKGIQNVPAKFPIVTFVDQITTDGLTAGAVESARMPAPASDPSLWDVSSGSPTKLKPCTGDACPQWFGATIMRHNNTKSLPELRAQQADVFSRLHYNMTGVHVEHVWPEYFPHWGVGDMEHLFNLRDRQGANGLFFTGGIAHFESIEFILRYNKWLAPRILDYLGGEAQPTEVMV